MAKVNSNDINLLRRDVAANCRVMLEMIADAGYDAIVTGTVRNDEYQRWCYDNGYSNATTPSFHSVKAGLAFDICKNKKGGEYSDMTFWKTVGAIGKKMGFTWGGDWLSFRDMPHFQWDEHGKFTGNMVRWGQYPPMMPLWEDDMTYEKFCEYMNKYLDVTGTGDKPSAWAGQATAAMKQAGVFNGDGKGNYGWQKPVTREALAVVLHKK